MLETFSCCRYTQSPWRYTTLHNKGKSSKVISWNTFGEGLGKSRKPPSYKASPRKKIRLDLNVSSNQKDNICDFSVQTGQEEVSQRKHEKQWNRLMLRLHLHLYLLSDLEKEKEILKEELFNLKTKLQEMEHENEKLENSNFCGYALSSDKICRHYAGFPSVKILESFSIF